MPRFTPGGELNFIGCLVMLGTSSLFVGLRSYVQIRSKQCGSGADWFCFSSLVIFTAYCAYLLTHILAVPVKGAFAATPSASPEKAESLMKVTFACSIIFINGITLAKLSILAGYKATFAIQRQYRHIIMGLAALCVAWWGCFILVTIFQCNPVQAMWDISDDRKRCLPVWKPLLAAEISNLIIDIMILITPILATWRLNLPAYKKWAVAGIFLGGGLVCASSILRLVSLARFGNEFDDRSKVMFYLTVQFGLAIICGCLLPLHGLFFRRNKGASKSRTSVYDATFREDHVSIPAYKLAGQLKKSKRGGSRMLSLARSWAGHDVRQGEESITPPPAARTNR
uniref:Rhodopsin domain-containing protein n=1 Tax=Bionectria ochroleuca TaxID=29856 RepID=A0A8H7NQ68_BIOOC